MPKPEGWTEAQTAKRDEIAKSLLADPEFRGRGAVERQQRAYQIATAQVQKMEGLESNPVDQSEKDTLEVDFVDRHSMQETLRALEEIAYGKAEHVLENWQDRELARRWSRIGQILDGAASAVEGQGVP